MLKTATIHVQRSERGQALVVFTIAIVGLFLMAGLLLDGGMLYVTHHNEQAAADGAAFAAGFAAAHSQDWNAAALSSAAQNGFDNDQTTNWVTVNSPPASGPYQGLANYIQVIILSQVETSLIQMVNPGSVQSRAEAVVKIVPSGPPGGSLAVLGVDPTACDTVLVNDPVNVNVNGGGILSNSNAASGSCFATVKNGRENPIQVATGGIQVVGAFQNNGEADTVIPAPVTGIQPASKLIFPAPDCSKASNFASGNSANQGDVTVSSDTTLNSGVYGAITQTAAASLTLNPGLYCITGDWNSTAGSVSGNGVVIVMLGGAFNINGSINVALSAPASATNLVSTDGSTYNYLGLLVFADPSAYHGSGDSHTIATGGANGSAYQGTIYAPNTPCALSGASGTVTFQSQVYCDTVSLSGSATLAMNFDPSQNWAVPPRINLEY